MTHRLRTSPLQPPELCKTFTPLVSEYDSQSFLNDFRTCRSGLGRVLLPDLPVKQGEILVSKNTASQSGSQEALISECSRASDQEAGGRPSTPN